jgi:hypothetical protein
VARFTSHDAIRCEWEHHERERGREGKACRTDRGVGAASPENSSRIHRCSLGYRWGGSLPSEQLLLPSRVVRWFSHGPPFALTLIHPSAWKVNSANVGLTGFYEVRASTNRSCNVRGWSVGSPHPARRAGSERAVRSARSLGPPLAS